VRGAIGSVGIRMCLGCILSRLRLTLIGIMRMGELVEGRVWRVVAWCAKDGRAARWERIVSTSIVAVITSHSFRANWSADARMEPLSVMQLAPSKYILVPSPPLKLLYT